MTKTRISCILLGLAVALSAVFAGVLPQSSAPANAETFDYTADMQAKVAKLPKNDTENFYILSSESDSPTILTLYPYMDGEDRRVWGLRLFDTYENSIKDPPNLGLYTLYENSGYSSANDFLRYSFDYNASRGQRYAKAGHETSEPVRIDNLGKSYSASKFLYIDKNFYPGGAYLLHYTNLPILPFSYYEKDGSTFTEEQRLTPVYTFHELSDYDGMPKGSFWGDIYAPQETLYLYVGFEKSINTVTFNYIDAAGKWTSSVQTYESGSVTITPPELPEAPFATFRAWDKTFATTITEDLVYNAVYSYEKFVVKFLSASGTVHTTRTLSYYDSFPDVVLPSYAEEVGNLRNVYAFDGWTTVEGDEKFRILRTSFRVQGETTLYPLWKLSKSTDISTGDVIFDSNDKENGGCSCSGGLITVIDDWNKSIRDQLPVGGGIVYYLLWILEIVTFVACIPLIVKGVMLLISGIGKLVVMIKDAVAKRRGR